MCDDDDARTRSRTRPSTAPPPPTATTTTTSADDDDGVVAAAAQTPPPPAPSSPPPLPPRELFDATTAPAPYRPDTIDFRHNVAARRHWLQCFDELIGKFAAQAARDTSAPEAARRAEAYRHDYMRWLIALREQFADDDAVAAEDDDDDDVAESTNGEHDEAGVLSMRTMLEHSERLLRRHGFADPWRDVKRAENAHAVAELPQRLAELDALRDDTGDGRRQRGAYWTELFRGLFAGNVFDWGAAAVTQIREQRGAFGLTEALAHIQQRPWQFDDLDAWLERVVGGGEEKTTATPPPPPPHRCAAVFVDNSGADIVLGVLPFVRELLRIGTKVILCANRTPSLNDVTCAELRALLAECGEHCAVLRRASEEGALRVADNGQSGPCLDMRHLSSGERERWL